MRVIDNTDLESKTPLLDRRGAVMIARLVLLMLILGSWEWSARAGWVNDFFTSSPSRIALFLWQVTSSGSIFIDIFYTLSETLAGFLIGSAGGVLLGLILGRWRRIDAILDPFLTFVNSMPRIALAPLFILWFGIGPGSKVILSVSLVFFIMTVNTRAGLRNIERDWIVVTRLLGASVRDIYQHVLIPAAVPMMFAGARLALVYSLLGAVVGELLSAQHGLGQQIAYYSGVFRVDAVLAIVIVLALLAVGLNSILLAIEARVTRWERRGGPAGEV